MFRFIFVCVVSLCFANDFSWESMHSEDKKYNLSICSIFGNDTRFLKEWIEYHQLIGVDHFYLYNNQECNGVREVLKPFIRKGVVSLIPWSQKLAAGESVDGFVWALGSQVPAYENAIYVRGAVETKWLVCLDIDEYLVPPQTDTIRDVLEQYDQSAGLILSSDSFDSSKMHIQPMTRLIIENTDLIFSPPINPKEEAVKIIFKPELCKGFSWPPYQCKFKEDRMAMKISRSELRVNRYVGQKKLFFYHFKKKLPVDNREMLERDVLDLLKEGYAIEDQEKAIGRFLPQLRKKLGLTEYYNEFGVPK
jgi:hypothetical protein